MKKVSTSALPVAPAAPSVPRGAPHIAFGVVVGLLVAAWASAFTGPEGTSGDELSVLAAGLEAGGLTAAEPVSAEHARAAREALGISWLPESVAAWAPLIVNSAEAHGVAPELVAIVMLVESGGHPEALSPAGAMGLMQVMPATGADIAAQRGLTYSVEQLKSPEVNVDFGAWYLADQLGRFGKAQDQDWISSVKLAAAAYNGGPGTVQALVRHGTALPAETSAYETWVSGMWQERNSATSATFERWLAAGGWRLVDAASTTIAMVPGAGAALP